MTQRAAHAQMTMSPPTRLDVDVETDPLGADLQLQESLLSSTSPYADPRLSSYSHSRFHTRKHSRSSSVESESSYISAATGQFDDADEYSPPHSAAKRRRSNDWPRQTGQGQGQTGSSSSPARKDGSGSGSYRWSFRASGSPRTGAGSSRSRQGVLPRGRRSRFVEGSMNDSVSEKPPSIYLRDGRPNNSEANNHHGNGNGNVNGPGHRSSGIFKFGKAIASAFNPFGGWSHVSDIWKHQQQQQQQENSRPTEQDPLAHVEQAYAELKRSGFKGTNKGSYMRDLEAGASNAIADETWKTIQDKMDYTKPPAPAGGRHSRQNSGEGYESNSSVRSSLQDLRKAKSSLGLFGQSWRRSDESEAAPEVRRQKSRKELQKQAKLLKRVSNLEDKLQRARRELQTFMGDEEEEKQEETKPAVSENHEKEKPYPRKFVPGALPSLPSERLLQESSSPPVSPTADAGALTVLSDNVQRLPEEEEEQARQDLSTTHRQAAPNTPKIHQDSQAQQNLSTDSPSLKRKSPDPVSVKAADAHPKQKGSKAEEAKSPLSGDASNRQSKVPKMTRADSPGRSRERSHHDKSDAYSSSEDRGRGRRRSPRPLRPSSAQKRASNSRNQAAPSLRLKKGRSDLRSASASASEDPLSAIDDQEDKENQQSKDMDKICFHNNQGPLDPDHRITTPSPTPDTTTPGMAISSSTSTTATNDRRKEKKYDYSYIPPVPPLPKDIAATAAKVDRRLAKEMDKKRDARTRRAKGHKHSSSESQAQTLIVQSSPPPQVVTGTATTTAGKRSFEWPDDIF